MCYRMDMKCIRFPFVATILFATPFVSAAELSAFHPTSETALAQAHDLLTKRFLGPEGLLFDYLGDLPTPKDCAEARPNAMGWWSPIENGPMFTGPYLSALCEKARRSRAETDRATCRKMAAGLLRAASVSSVKGMIVRGFATDGAAHYPLGSEDQTLPWFFGLHAYAQSGIPSPAERAHVVAKMEEVADALQALDWKCPCDGRFTGESRGNFKHGLAFRAAAHYLYILRAMADVTGSSVWLDRYVKACEEQHADSGLTRLEICGKGYVTDLGKFPVEPDGLWIYVCAQGCLKALATLDGDARRQAAFRAGLKVNADRARAFFDRAAKFDNSTEVPFRYANWRTGYTWRDQPTQKIADAVSSTANKKILGTRKWFERSHMTTPLSACAIVAYARDEDDRAAIAQVLRHYDYATLNISEFYLAEVAWYALPDPVRRPSGAVAALRADFTAEKPPMEAALRTFNKWIGDNLSKEGFTRDFAAMGEAEIATADIDDDAMMGHHPQFGGLLLSPAWMEVYRHALKEAGKNGVRMIMHNCPGWSACGGPWIKPEDSMKVVVTSAKEVAPGTAAGVLPQPATRHGFYRDLAVKAFPVDAVPAVVSGAGPWKLPFATNAAAPAVFEMTFARPFTPRAVAVQFVQNTYNCEGTVEGAAADGTWRELATFCYHTHFANAAKLIPLAVTAPLARVRFVFRANAVPEWQGAKPKDIDVQEVTFSTVHRVAEADAKSSAVAPFAYHPPADPVLRGLARDETIDVPVRPAADGTLAWTAPARTDGRTWCVLRLGYTTSGVKCGPATVRGLECDKLSPRGVELHWPHMPAKLLEPPEAKGVVDTLYVDSWEAGGQNWTEDFPDQFRRRRGYDFMPYLPVMAGYLMDDALTTSKVLFDIQRTVDDLICENFYRHYTDVCHAHGVRFGAQAYGGPFDNLRALPLSDEPQGEFWLGGKEYRITPRLAASAAHVAGLPVASAESFTTESAPGRWQITPAELREYAEWAWVEGINRIVYHCYVQQPVEAKPGLSLGRHGTQLNRHTTWWPEMKWWSRYVRRAQTLLSAGVPDTDILVVQSEDKPQSGRAHPEVLAAGFTYDLCSPITFRDMLQTPQGTGLAAGAKYPVVFLEEGYYALATLAHVQALRRAGAQIAGPRPVGTPTLSDNPAAWRRLVDELWPTPAAAVTDPLAALRKFDRQPAVASAMPLASIRRRLGDGSSAFLVLNTGDKPFQGAVTFAATGRGEVWNAVDGSVTPFDGTLALPPRRAAFVVFDATVAKTDAVAPAQAAEKELDLSTGWTIVSFAGNAAPRAPVAMPRLTSWSASADEALKHFSGRAVYERTVTGVTGERIVLDLGDVRDVANVFVDGAFVKCLWDKPYRVELPAACRTGKPFTLRVEVVNTWPNRLIGDAVLRAKGVSDGPIDRGWPKWVLDGKTESGTGLTTWSNFDYAWKATDALRPAGLLGPVKLLY